MLSYRHSFHAGNAADVFKHLILIYCLKYLLQKDAPLLCVDTHAGAGTYRLNKYGTKEWMGGIGKLRENREKFNINEHIKHYLELTCNENGIYPGSPVIMGKLLRRQDRLVCFELHPKDYAELDNAFRNYRDVAKSAPACADVKCSRIEARHEHGLLSLKSLLPPPFGRGLILIDPSWEEKDEYVLIPQQITAALKRYALGTYIIWYPLLIKQKTADSDTIGRNLYNLHAGCCCRAEIYDPEINSSINSPRGMYGSGLVIFNPPWKLNHDLKNILPLLVTALTDGGRYNLEWKD